MVLGLVLLLAVGVLVRVEALLVGHDVAKCFRLGGCPVRALVGLRGVGRGRPPAGWGHEPVGEGRDRQPRAGSWQACARRGGEWHTARGGGGLCTR